MSNTVSTNWDSSFTTTSINSSTVTNGSSATTGAIDNNNKAGTEVTVTIAYGSPANSGVIVSVLRIINGTPTYESGANDTPWSFALNYNASSTYNRAFTVPADRVSKFEVYVSNNSGASVTATVQYKQFTVQIT